MTEEGLRTDPSDHRRHSMNPAVTAAIVSGVFGLLSFAASYLLVSRSQAELQRQSVDLDRLRTELSAQTVAIERGKAEIAASAQRTSELVASIDEQRLSLERQVAAATTQLESRRQRVDEGRARTDEVRITPDFTKLMNDLRPNLDIKCTADYTRSPTVRLECNIRNIGQHKAFIRSERVVVLDIGSRTEIAQGVTRVQLPDVNEVPVGITGLNVFDVSLSQDAASRKQIIFQLTFSSVTDELASRIAARLSKGVVTQSEIEQAARQRHTYTLTHTR